jgi:membrane-associated phospholipid phosphatase
LLGSEELEQLDLKVLIGLRTHGHGDLRIEKGIELFSRAGEHGACWYALGVLGWAYTKPDDPRRKAWSRGVAITAAAYGLNYAVKRAVRRRRPQLEGLPALSPVISVYSFPSAHSTTSFAAATAYSAAAPAAAPLFYAVAAAFAISRPYLAVHYPSDVLAGAALGTLAAKLLTSSGTGS